MIGNTIHFLSCPSNAAIEGFGLKTGLIAFISPTKQALLPFLLQSREIYSNPMILWIGPGLASLSNTEF